MGNKEQRKQWHMGFYGAMELEFRENRNSLEFYREYQLSKKPLEMDMLIVRKNRDVLLKNKIGEIFRKHNIIEYKSPNDVLGIDQFYKGIAYVCLYKSLGQKADEISASELTLTFIRERYPSKLIGQLRSMNCEIIECSPGIYSVANNLLFPVQIVVTSQLETEGHLSLKVLSDRIDRECAKLFLRKMRRLQEPGDRDNVDAVLQISVSANKRLYDEIKEDNRMCDALRELMKDEIEEEKSKAIAEGRAEGRAEGKLDSIKALMKNLKISAEQAMEYIGIPKNEYKKYMQML